MVVIVFRLGASLADGRKLAEQHIGIAPSALVL
jgi:hypothetical protein